MENFFWHQKHKRWIRKNQRQSCPYPLKLVSGIAYDPDPSSNLLWWTLRDCQVEGVCRCRELPSLKGSGLVESGKGARHLRENPSLWAECSDHRCAGISEKREAVLDWSPERRRHGGGWGRWYMEGVNERWGRNGGQGQRCEMPWRWCRLNPECLSLSPIYSILFRPCPSPCSGST